MDRIRYTILQNAIILVKNINQITKVDLLLESGDTRFRVPNGSMDNNIEWVKQEMLYQLLEKDKRAIAIHAGEIWQIMVTGIAFSNGDFEKTIPFIVNYGRDKDTVVAIAGMILGAQNGYTNLPENLKTEIIKVNKNYLGLDL